MKRLKKSKGTLALTRGFPFMSFMVERVGFRRWIKGPKGLLP